MGRQCKRKPAYLPLVAILDEIEVNYFSTPRIAGDSKRKREW